MSATVRDPEGLIECARAAEAGGREQPSSASDVQDRNGATIIILVNTNGVLATYRLDGETLKRIADLSRYDMYFEDRHEFVTAVFHLFGAAGEPGVRNSSITPQRRR